MAVVVGAVVGCSLLYMALTGMHLSAAKVRGPASLVHSITLILCARATYRLPVLSAGAAGPVGADRGLLADLRERDRRQDVLHRRPARDEVREVPLAHGDDGEQETFVSSTCPTRPGKTARASLQAALSLMTVISVGIGYVFKNVPEVGRTRRGMVCHCSLRHLEAHGVLQALKTTAPVGEYLSVALLFWFGLTTLWGALRSQPQQAEGEGQQFGTWRSTDPLAYSVCARRFASPLQRTAPSMHPPPRITRAADSASRPLPRANASTHLVQAPLIARERSSRRQGRR